MVVAGDHFENDAMGDKDSLKSELLAHKHYEIQAIDRGLGNNDGVIRVYLDHWTDDLDTFGRADEGEKEKSQ